MIWIEFTQEKITELNYQRYRHPHPRVQQKMEVLYLKSQGLAHQEIRRLCNISKTTLTTYLKQYLEGGTERLKQLDYHGQPSELNQHASSLEDYFKVHPPQTMVEAQAKIGVAETRDDLPSSPTLLPKEKGARIPVPSPSGRGLG